MRPLIQFVRMILLVVPIVCLAASSQGEDSQAETPEPASTEAVLGHHLASFGAGDLEGILADYATDAVFMTPNGVLRGTDEIEGLFTGLFEEFGKPGATFEMAHSVVEGDYAYIIWSAETPDNVYEYATDTFVIRNGKIVAQSFAGKIVPKK